MDQKKQARAATLMRLTDRLNAGLKILDRLDQRFFRARLVTVSLGAVATFLGFGFGPETLGWKVLAGSVAAFGVVVFFHRRMDRRRVNYGLFLKWAATQVARLQLDWKNIPASPELGVEANHPFASDLDLVGDHSLHQLIDTATSRGGSERLAAWLLSPTLERSAIEHRQALIQEILALNGFRTGLAMKGMQVKAATAGQWNGEKLLGWLGQEAPPRSFLPVLILLFGLGFCNLVLYGLFAMQLIPAYWMISLTLYAGIYLFKFGEYKSLFEDAYTISQSLGTFRNILLFLETYPYPAGSGLGRLSAPFTQVNRRPSRHLNKIVWITSAASLDNNPFLALLINTIVPWNLFFAHLLNGYKAELRITLPQWLDTWYDLEAYQSLANFAYLNPTTTFPRILLDEQPLFEVHGLGHPLLNEDVKVRNDFSISGLGEVAIITGSNMSGKSTFLRTLGVNLCLAFAGGPVDAEQLSTGLFRVFTCIQVNDSLSNGISYFYAEVRRLKLLLNGLENHFPQPMFFLIDEIFRGTNNRERQIGSQAYVRALAKGYGAGAISTHDLELAKLSELGLNILNYHFREDIKEQRMVFDYRLRLGASPTTNALRIMELEGLPVGEDLTER